MIRWLYEVVTGTPWTTGRSMAAEFGPTLATRHPELSLYSDRDLVTRGDEILTEIRSGLGRRTLTEMEVAR